MSLTTPIALNCQWAIPLILLRPWQRKKTCKKDIQVVQYCIFIWVRKYPVRKRANSLYIVLLRILRSPILPLRLRFRSVPGMDILQGSMSFAPYVIVNSRRRKEVRQLLLPIEV